MNNTLVDTTATNVIPDWNPEDTGVSVHYQDLKVHVTKIDKFKVKLARSERLEREEFAELFMAYRKIYMSLKERFFSNNDPTCDLARALLKEMEKVCYDLRRATFKLFSPFVKPSTANRPMENTSTADPLTGDPSELDLNDLDSKEPCEQMIALWWMHLSTFHRGVWRCSKVGELPEVTKRHAVWADSTLSSVYSYVRARGDISNPEFPWRQFVSLSFAEFKLELGEEEQMALILNTLYPNDIRLSACVQEVMVKMMSTIKPGGIPS